MGMVYVGAVGDMGGQGSLRTPLGPAMIDLLGVTYVDMHGCHLNGYISLHAVRDR